MRFCNKLWSMLCLVALILGCCITVACADVVRGSTAGSTTFYVDATSSNSWIELKSFTGTMKVGNGNITFNHGGYTYEDHYGFYRINLSSNQYSAEFLWIPSASSIKTVGLTCYSTDPLFKIEFPAAGVYTVTVNPMKADRYWIDDTDLGWDVHAEWTMHDYNRCSISNRMSPVPEPPVYSGNIMWVEGYQREQTNASRLIDGNTNSCYEYIIYSSEFRDNGHIELTFFIDGGSVSQINFWNGDQSSSSNYYRYSRAREIRVHIHTNSGDYTEYMYPDDRNGMQTYYMSRNYSNVNSIDFDILHTYDGSEINFVRISEVAFN